MANYSPIDPATVTPAQMPPQMRAGGGPQSARALSIPPLPSRFKPIAAADVLAPINADTDFAGPASGPVSEAMAANNGGLKILDVPSMLPKVEVSAIGSLPKDPAAKAQYIASKLFPDEPPQQALQRMGSDGVRLYYIAHDGQAYYAEPAEFSPIQHPMQTLKNLPNTAAANIGPAIPIAASIGGGAATAEFGGGVPGAAAGGAAGEAARQFLANLLTDERQAFTGRLMDVGQAAVEGGAGQAMGLGLAKGGSALLNRNPLKVGAYDASTLTKPRLAEVQANSDLARNMGVTVTPGEAGNVASLLANQRQMARQPEANTILNDFYQKRNLEQIPGAWDAFLSKVSPNAVPAVANRDLQAAAGDVIKSQIASRSGKATGIYTEAFDANAAVRSPRIAQIIDTPSGKEALTGVMTDLRNGLAGIDPADPKYGLMKDEIAKIEAMINPPKGAAATPDLGMRTYDLVKQKLYDLEQNAKGEHGASTLSSRYIGNLRTALTTELDNADVTAVYDAATGKVIKPGKYAEARKMFETNSPPVTEAQKGIVGIVAKDKRTALQNLPKVLFSASSSDPYSIAQAKSAFRAAGEMDKWHAGVRSFLQNTFDEAVKQGGDAGPTGNLWKTITGDKRQLANLKTALDPSQFSAMEDFMKVAEMVKRAPKEGAATATDLGARARMAGPVAKGAAAVVKGTNPLNLPTMWADGILDASAGKNAAALAKAITDPRAVAQLKKLRVLTPGTQKFVQEFGALASLMGWSAATSPGGMPVMPGGFSPTGDQP